MGAFNDGCAMAHCGSTPDGKDEEVRLLWVRLRADTDTDTDSITNSGTCGRPAVFAPEMVFSLRIVNQSLEMVISHFESAVRASSQIRFLYPFSNLRTVRWRDR